SGAPARWSRGALVPEPGVTVVRVPPAGVVPVYRNALVVDARRSSVWAAGPFESIVVLDEHDEGLKEERVPTWHARDVAIERARRAGVPCVLISPCPSLDALALVGEAERVSRADERHGWPVLDIVDRRKDDPRTGLYSQRLVALLRSERR